MFAPVMGALLTWHRDSLSTENVCIMCLWFHLSPVKGWHWLSSVWRYSVVFQ